MSWLSLLSSVLALAGWLLPRLFPDKAKALRESISEYVPGAERRRALREKEEKDLNL